MNATGAEDPPLRILVAGPPGIGKTTVARRVATRLGAAGVALAGFLTDELRESGRRVGFAVESFDGRRAILAHVDLAASFRVGRYGVDLEAFERVALPSLARDTDREVVVLDELGKMELASSRFRGAVLRLFQEDVSVIATVQVARHPFTDALKRRDDIETVFVSGGDRDALPEELVRRVEARRTGSSA